VGNPARPERVAETQRVRKRPLDNAQEITCARNAVWIVSGKPGPRSIGVLDKRAMSTGRLLTLFARILAFPRRLGDSTRARAGKTAGDEPPLPSISDEYHSFGTRGEQSSAYTSAAAGLCKLS
jgi:hypothetical protein